MLQYEWKDTQETNQSINFDEFFWNYAAMANGEMFTIINTNKNTNSQQVLWKGT